MPTKNGSAVRCADSAPASAARSASASRPVIDSYRMRGHRARLHQLRSDSAPNPDSRFTIISVEQPPGAKRQSVVVDDYGTGGIWGLIAAESAEAITRRYPQLRVITIGDPDWVTPEKYSEIVNDWIKPFEHFDIDHPTGWLADWDERLSTPTEPSA